MASLVTQLFDGATLGYFLVLDIVYLGLAVVGWRAVNEYVRRRPIRDYEFVAHSELSPPISVLVPAHNEEPTIVESVRALCACRYPQLEIIVINDGSTDSTLRRLTQAFALVAVRRVPSCGLTTKPIRALYASQRLPNLTVIDKAGGGKADALNAGLRYAWTPLVCSIDADTLIDADALTRLVWEFERRPETVAAGGIVRVINGSRVRDGRVEEARLPRNLLANLQILEYLRAFLGGRIAWSRLGMLLIISGAFGLFRREVVVQAGGYDTTTVGEDAELVLRIHHQRRDDGLACRIIFFPDPICWTEVPTRLGVLRRQRDRWQRGLIEMLLRHRQMIGRPRYGAVGLAALPFFVIFEALGPLIEVFGYAVFAVSIALGAVSLQIVVLFLVIAIGFGFTLTFITLLMEERAFQRYASWNALGKLLLASLVENLGYRQWLALVRAGAWISVFRSRGNWGEMTRSGFAGDSSTAQEARTPLPALR